MRVLDNMPHEVSQIFQVSLYYAACIVSDYNALKHYDYRLSLEY